MMSEGNRVRADQVSGDRTTGRVIATGNVAATTAEGDTAYGDRVELTDTLRDAVVDNILLVLERGGRIAARSGSRTDGRTVLSHAVYSPCDVRSEEHTSELQSLMRISYAVFCLKKKT